MKRLFSTITAAALLAVLSLSGTALASDTLTLKSGTKIAAEVLDTLGAHITVVEQGAAVVLDKKMLASYTYKGVLHVFVAKASPSMIDLEMSSRAQDDDVHYKDPDGYNATELSHHATVFTTMAVVGGLMLCTGIPLVVNGSDMADDSSDRGFNMVVVGIPLIAGGSTMLGIGIHKGISYHKRLSRLNLSAQFGHDKTGLRLSYNF